MLTKTAIEYFGTQANLARRLGIRPQSISDWGETVPPLRQLQIDKITHGALPADPGVLDPVPGEVAPVSQG